MSRDGRDWAKAAVETVARAVRPFVHVVVGVVKLILRPFRHDVHPGLKLLAIIGYLYVIQFGYVRIYPTSTIVTAETTRLEATMQENAAAWVLGDVTICRKRPRPDRSLQGTDGPCALSTYVVTQVGSEVAAAGERPESFVLDPPFGTRLVFEIIGEDLVIAVDELPDSAASSTKFSEDMLVVVGAERIEDLGRFLFHAQIGIGSLPKTEVGGYLDEGRIVFRGPTSFSLISKGAYVTLREEDLETGGFVRFTDRLGERDTTMLVQVIGQRDRMEKESFFLVQATDEGAEATTWALLEYGGSETIRLAPGLLDLLKEDPLVIVLAAIGSAAGLVALFPGRNGV
ncbi:hypothetical protein [Algicella marina]|uniref:Uncharacterized protein n=1 Tax=Algicella marina TaxID=2683284 RepID=A0A6P1STW7_9RHOB|nr:hypothetical protein [Algicella marina]QHQ33868.1 hypothetical protein GO499_01065 [Algicella marina]